MSLLAASLLVSLAALTAPDPTAPTPDPTVLTPLFVPHVPGAARCALELELAALLEAGGADVRVSTVGATLAEDAGALALRHGAPVVTATRTATGLTITLTRASGPPAPFSARTLDDALAALVASPHAAALGLGPARWLALPWVVPAVACRAPGAPAPRLEADVAALLGLGPPVARREAEPRRRAITDELDAGALVERWSTGGAPARVTRRRLFALGPVATLVGEGDASFFAARDGRPLGQVQLGRGLAAVWPAPTPSGRRGALLFAERELVLLDLDARTVRRRVPLDAPLPEHVLDGGALYVAGASQILRLDVATASIAWTHEPPRDVPLGPVATPTGLAYAQGAALVVLDRATAAVREQHELAGEITGLWSTSSGVVLALVGADRVALVREGEAKPPVVRIAGLVWPPLAELADPPRALLGTRDRRRGAGVTQLVLDGRASTQPLALGAALNVRARPGGGVVVERRDELVQLDARGLVRHRTTVAPNTRLLDADAGMYALLAPQLRLAIARTSDARRAERPRDARGAVVDARLLPSDGGHVVVMTRDDGAIVAYTAPDHPAHAALVRRIARPTELPSLHR
jgi:hypothetical protein